ncbi:hypothetical protein [Lacticaseibacillus camelliae]|uniref:Uncharacterized protein n=1 Tax=Lacticaseibacillus camelliae DSM 22697 = JCM 13995 TaxID=1423730 RepID=A0A0R2EZ22_9LACO|nr:hypothetical protein [Lacticaseibacillus camelliae]KRN21593.1 hypothetical protein FC75_GL002163 [Lacticaseibacillus camelliae DSM 22697 = JCM 13995]
MATTLSALVVEMAAERPVITVTDQGLISLLFSFSDAWQPLPSAVAPDDTLQRGIFAAQAAQLVAHASLGLALHMQPRRFVYAAYFDAPVPAVQQFFLHAGQYEFILVRPNQLTLTLVDFL